MTTTLVHTERVKLLATTLNTIGLAAIAAGVLAPTAGGLYGKSVISASVGRIVAAGLACLALGLALTTAARFTLRGLRE